MRISTVCKSESEPEADAIASERFDEAIDTLDAISVGLSETRLLEAGFVRNLRLAAIAPPTQVKEFRAVHFIRDPS